MKRFLIAVTVLAVALILSPLADAGCGKSSSGRMGIFSRMRERRSERSMRGSYSMYSSTTYMRSTTYMGGYAPQVPPTIIYIKSGSMKSSDCSNCK